MYQGMRVGAVIPALDEAPAIGAVVAGLLELEGPQDGRLIDDLVVGDNGSTDGTADLARLAGARVATEAQRGYGAACLAAIASLRDADILLFVDGDRSAVPEQALRLLALIAGGADLAIGSRALGRAEPGALTWPQILGNRLVTWLMRLIWRTPVTDLGPFRAIRRTAFEQLGMAERTYGWTVEMQVKAIQRGLVVAEAPVDTLRRLGRSKVSGTWRGVLGAARGLLWTLAKLWWAGRSAGRSLPQLRTQP
jgi:glycosyltransferase involved in cell wall biosynthesis